MVIDTSVLALATWSPGTVPLMSRIAITALRVSMSEPIAVIAAGILERFCDRLVAVTIMSCVATAWSERVALALA